MKKLEGKVAVITGASGYDRAWRRSSCNYEFSNRRYGSRFGRGCLCNIKSCPYFSLPFISGRAFLTKFYILTVLKCWYII